MKRHRLPLEGPRKNNLMSEQALDKLSQTFCRVFHNQKWDRDGPQPSEINRQAWKNCVLAVIEEYKKLDEGK